MDIKSDIISLHLSNEDDILFCGMEDGTLISADAVTLDILMKFEHTTAIDKICSNASFVFCSGHGGKGSFWNRSNWRPGRMDLFKELKPFEDDEQRIVCIGINDTNAFAISGRRVKIFALGDGISEVRSLTLEEVIWSAKSAAFDGQEGGAVWIGVGERLVLYDEGGIEVTRVPFPGQESIRSISRLPSRIWIGTEWGSIYLFDKSKSSLESRGELDGFPSIWQVQEVGKSKVLATVLGKAHGSLVVKDAGKPEAQARVIESDFNINTCFDFAQRYQCVVYPNKKEVIFNHVGNSLA